MKRFSQILATLAITTLPLASAHAQTANPCGDLPPMVANLRALTTQARDLVQLDNARLPDPRLTYALNDLNYILNTVIPTYSPYADTAAAQGTPAGGAAAYQVHSGIIAPQGIDAELNDAEHWLISYVYATSMRNAYDAVWVIISAHNAATALDQTAMRCYLSNAATNLH